MSDFGYPYEDNPEGRPSERLSDHMERVAREARARAARRAIDPRVAGLGVSSTEDVLAAKYAGKDMDAPDPDDVARIAANEAKAHELVEAFAAAWLVLTPDEIQAWWGL